MGVYFNKEEELEHRIELLEIAMGNIQLAMGESNNKEKATLPINSVSFSLRDKLASEAFIAIYKEQEKLNPRGYMFGCLDLDTKRSYKIADAIIKARSNER